MTWSKERYFELVVVVYPDFADQVSPLFENLKKVINDNQGRVTREENWGRRQLAYRIEKVSKGYYLLINFSCSNRKLIDFLQDQLDGSDNVLRYLITTTKSEISDLSPVAKDQQKEEVS